MRLARFTANGGEVTVGVVEGDAVCPVLGAARLVDFDVGEPLDLGDPVPLDEVELKSPVLPLVRNVFCVGWNYDNHFAEGSQGRHAGEPSEIPDRPTFFTKATTSIIGPPDAIDLHAEITPSLDWEVELAVVIRRGGCDISEQAAVDHILGYTVANDVSARNVQRDHGGQWFRGKSLDRTSPIGPWVVTPDEIGDLAERSIMCRLNGETVQSARLGDLHFGIQRIIAELSRGLTLLPGDVILTGTPSGVGFARTPPRYLADGDELESEIEGIGLLRNRVCSG